MGLRSVLFVKANPASDLVLGQVLFSKKPSVLSPVWSPKETGAQGVAGMTWNVADIDLTDAEADNIPSDDRNRIKGTTYKVNDVNDPESLVEI